MTSERNSAKKKIKIEIKRNAYNKQQEISNLKNLERYKLPQKELDNLAKDMWNSEQKMRSNLSGKG